MNNSTYLKFAEQDKNTYPVKRSKELIESWRPLEYNTGSAYNWLGLIIDSLPLELKLINQRLSHATIIIPGHLFIKLKDELIQRTGYTPSRTEDGFFEVAGFFIGFDLFDYYPDPI